MCSIDRLAGALVNLKIYDILHRYHKPRRSQGVRQLTNQNITINNNYNTSITNEVNNTTKQIGINVHGKGNKIDIRA